MCDWVAVVDVSAENVQLLGCLCLSWWVGGGSGSQLKELKTFQVICAVVMLVAVGAAFAFAGGVGVVDLLAFITV